MKLVAEEQRQRMEQLELQRRRANESDNSPLSRAWIESGAPLVQSGKCEFHAAKVRAPPRARAALAARRLGSTCQIESVRGSFAMPSGTAIECRIGSGGHWRPKSLRIIRRCAPWGRIYLGTAGIATFLARLSSVTGDERQRATAIGALRHAIDQTGRGHGASVLIRVSAACFMPLLQ